MDDLREKVIQGLEICKADLWSRDTCKITGCPYADIPDGTLQYRSCRIKLMDDALSLLKAQEPRVLTLEELDAIYQTKERHTWPFNTPPYLWMTVNPDVRKTRGFWICWRDIMYSLENDSPFYVRENYGKVWKIWTAEPTDEQREEAQWNKEK